MRTPEQSNKIAVELGVDDKTVGAVRRQLESTSEIPKLDRTVGADGKARSTRRRLTVVRGIGLRQAARVADMAADIASAAASDPLTHGRLLHAISRTGQVGGAHRNLMVSRRAAEISAEPPPLPEGPFRVIVADPPWKYDARAEDPSHRAANPYPQMSLEDICTLPVIDHAHEDAVLWLSSWWRLARLFGLDPARRACHHRARACPMVRLARRRHWHRRRCRRRG